MPSFIDTDIGPVIDVDAKNKIDNHISKFQKKILGIGSYKDELNGFFVCPTIIEIDNLTDLKEEIFGPVIHVYKYKAENIEKLVKDINVMNYGLTLGMGIKYLENNTFNLGFKFGKRKSDFYDIHDEKYFKLYITLISTEKWLIK